MSRVQVLFNMLMQGQAGWQNPLERDVRNQDADGHVTKKSWNYIPKLDTNLAH